MLNPTQKLGIFRWWKRKYGSLKQMLTDDDAVMDRLFEWAKGSGEFRNA